VRIASLQQDPAAAVVSGLVGIVGFLAEIALVPGSPDVFVAAARGPYMELFGQGAGTKIIGSGAGLGWDIAAGAATGECLERYCSALVDPDDFIFGSYEEVCAAGRRATEPDGWALFATSQDVPYRQFTPKTRIAWREGWELATGLPHCVPACFCYLSSAPELTTFDSTVVGPAISTGCACAARKETALLGGLYELIERDAFMIVWRNQLSVPEVVIDPASALFGTFGKRFDRPGLQYRLWQTTLDLPVPSFFGILFDRRQFPTRMIVGGAANLDAERAALKTLCELTQGLAWLDSASFKETAPPEDFQDIRSFSDRARFYAAKWQPEAFSFLLDSSSRPLSSISSLELSEPDAIRAVVDLLSHRGINAIAVDLTTPDVLQAGFTVTRVIVPGLETMDGDFNLQMLGGRRWRDVPVQLGLRSTTARLADINPYPHPYP
jgi:ribosomal protein S12 methylthiotransferase accessory factor